MTTIDKPIIQKAILTVGLMFSAFAWSAPSEYEIEPHPIDTKY